MDYQQGELQTEEDDETHIARPNNDQFYNSGKKSARVLINRYKKSVSNMVLHHIDEEDFEYNDLHES